MTALPGLVLGTVQFGTPYGIANPGERPPSEEEVRRVLERAAQAGIRLLDTAPVYGDAETRLGRLGAASSFGLITKVPASGQETIDEAAAARVGSHLDASLERLGTDTIEALLFHDAGDLLRPGGERLWEAAVAARGAGRVRRLGVSVYEPGQLRAVMERYPVELVQMPANVYDGRFAQAGLLDAMHERRITVHVRSVFLQGALLQPSDALPGWLGGLRETQARLHLWAREMEADPVTVSLAAVCAQAGVDALVVGCRGVEELEEILEGYEHALRRPELGEEALERFRLSDEALLDPRRWPR